MLYFYYVARMCEVGAYVRGLYITNGIAAVVSFFLLLPYLRKPEAESCRRLSVVKEMLAYGLWGSADNLAETCTMRLSYFLVERFVGLGGVGLLDAATKIAESVWNISRSVASIAYQRIAKSRDNVEQKRISLQLFRLTLVAIAAVMAVILLIPEWVYTDYLFGPDFKGIREVIALLSVGIVALGGNSILSHYFIGSGKVRYSTASSCIGLGGLLVAGLLLIPSYGVAGAALSTSMAFCAMLLFSLVYTIKT
jgi:O-antigen/teichoic acid export membrane protein